MNSSKLLIAIIVLQSLILLSQWTGPATTAHAARDANLPDPGARQLAMVDELKALNAKVERLHGLLQSGEVRVRVERQEERKPAR